MSGALATMTGGQAGRQLTVGHVSVYYGYGQGSFGSMTPTEFLSSQISGCYYQSDVTSVRLVILDSAHANSGWTSMTVNGVTFLRADASYGGGVWTWSGAGNPFGTTVGAIISVNIA